MFRDNVSFVIAIALLAVIADGTAFICVEETACSCHLPNGTLYDLNHLSAQGFVKSNANNFNFTFLFQPCKNIKMEMDPGAANECNKEPGVSLCARLNGEKPFSLGNTTETRWNVLDSGVELTLSHANYSTRISLLCCKSCTAPTLSLDAKPEKSEYRLTLSSQFACQVHEAHRGLSTGSILVILLLVFAGVYLLVGALALHFLRGAIGWEMIPNYDFWAEIPGLFRDGVVYTFSGCSATTYERI